MEWHDIGVDEPPADDTTHYMLAYADFSQMYLATRKHNEFTGRPMWWYQGSTVCDGQVKKWARIPTPQPVLKEG